MPHAAFRPAGFRTTAQSRAAPDGEIADMKAYLARVAPQSIAEALRLLRNAYPDAPLGRRVAACGLAAG